MRPTLPPSNYLFLEYSIQIDTNDHKADYVGGNVEWGRYEEIAEQGHCGKYCCTAHKSSKKASTP